MTATNSPALDGQVDAAQRAHGSALRFERLAEANRLQHFRRCRHKPTVNRGRAERNQVTWGTDAPAALLTTHSLAPLWRQRGAPSFFCMREKEER